ncbi:hypothetical protein FB451DRAFT_439356 [Mycena latifolia]|nr:hypothetical protein FB451DRAFT_439356 [Mycena latifolia]
MGHGHARLTLLLKPYLILGLTQVALSMASPDAPNEPDDQNPSTHQTPPKSPGPGGTQKSQPGDHNPTSTNPGSGPQGGHLPGGSTGGPSSHFTTFTHSDSTSSQPAPTTSATNAITSSTSFGNTRTSTSTPLSTDDITSSTSGFRSASSTGLPTNTESTPAVIQLPTEPPASTSLPPSDPSVPSTPLVLAATKSTSKMPIIVGVLVPLFFILAGAAAFILYKRRQRVRDRLEWERTHEAIADAVRQVNEHGVRGTPSYAGSGAWSHLDLASRGDLVYTQAPVADPFVDGPPDSHEHAAFGTGTYSPEYHPAHSPYGGAVASRQQSSSAISTGSTDSVSPLHTSFGSHPAV